MQPVAASELFLRWADRRPDTQREQVQAQPRRIRTRQTWQSFLVDVVRSDAPKRIKRSLSESARGCQTNNVPDAPTPCRRPRPTSPDLRAWRFGRRGARGSYFSSSVEESEGMDRGRARGRARSRRAERGSQPSSEGSARGSGPACCAAANLACMNLVAAALSEAVAMLSQECLEGGAG
jgi:hypothetical protein